MTYYLGHATFGVAGCLAALWVFVEVLNSRVGNDRRIRAASFLAAVCMVAARICGGYWYLHFYPEEKALILAGPWPFAHNIFMETKEHLFFIAVLLAPLLPIAVRQTVDSNCAARKLVLSMAGMACITALAMEGFGALIDHGVKVALLQHAR